METLVLLLWMTRNAHQNLIGLHPNTRPKSHQSIFQYKFRIHHQIDIQSYLNFLYSWKTKKVRSNLYKIWKSKQLEFHEPRNYRKSNLQVVHWSHCMITCKKTTIPQCVGHGNSRCRNKPNSINREGWRETKVWTQ